MEVVQPIDVGPTNETKGKALGLTRLDATGDQPVGEQLRAALMHNFSRVVDLFRDWDDDRNGTVSRKEFRMVLPVLGLSVPRSEADGSLELLYERVQCPRNHPFSLEHAL